MDEWKRTLFQFCIVYPFFCTYKEVCFVYLCDIRNGFVYCIGYFGGVLRFCIIQIDTLFTTQPDCMTVVDVTVADRCRHVFVFHNGEFVYQFKGVVGFIVSVYFSFFPYFP